MANSPAHRRYPGIAYEAERLSGVAVQICTALTFGVNFYSESIKANVRDWFTSIDQDLFFISVVSIAGDENSSPQSLG